ncbi:MAG: hypothetical protein LLG20_18885 [Acidobacteriales bacterium]|nr:hypothetical protein [Terriglobales bacterium]
MNRTLALLEPRAVFDLIVACIWVLRAIHPNLWMAILRLMLPSHLLRRERPGYFAWGSGRNSTPVRDHLLEVPGVRKLVVENVWTPARTSNRLTTAGRCALGLD